MGSYHLYFGACDDHGGIYHYIYQNGEFKFREKTDAPRPMYFDREGDTLHVLLQRPYKENMNSALLDFSIGNDGSLHQQGTMIDTMGKEACHLCHKNGYVYAANYFSGSVFSTAGIVDVHEGRGVHPTRQEATHTHFVDVSPDGRYLLSTDLGIDTIFVYDDALNRVGEAKVPLGHGCRHLAYSEDGRFVFCANELTSTVSVFAYRNGQLDLIETVEALQAGHPANTAAAIRVRGSRVYVSQRGCNVISILSWDGSHLTLLGVYDCGGKSPRDFMLLEDMVIVTNERSDSVSILKINGDTLTDTGKRLTMESPLCVIAIPAVEE